MSYNLDNIKNAIEKLGKVHHIEILKILKKTPSITLNENKSGIYINLSFLPSETLSEISNYLDYVNDQETSIMKIETQKNEVKTNFFVEKDNKDNDLIPYRTSVY